MIDIHVHFLHNKQETYTNDLFNELITTAVNAELEEIYILEHSFQFHEFEMIFEPIKSYNTYQKEWLSRKMNSSIERYLNFIESIKQNECPINVKFGLEVCYIPETADKLSDVLKQYRFDFLVGAIHWIDRWGFDHPKQKETWLTTSVNESYKRYYEIMFELCASGLFNGLAHPDSIKCFGYIPTIDLTDDYSKLANILNQKDMYAENSGGLRLNYCSDLELGLNKELLNVFKSNKTKILPASDAHKVTDVGANVPELLEMIEGD